MPGVREFAPISFTPFFGCLPYDYKQICILMRTTAPDAVAQVKKGLRGLFSRRKSKQGQAQQSQPQATSTTKDDPTRTAPAAPAPGASAIAGGATGMRFVYLHGHLNELIVTIRFLSSTSTSARFHRP